MKSTYQIILVLSQRLVTLQLYILTTTNQSLQVHHINGKGEDSGVVYSEMQGRQNTSGDLMALE